MKSVSEFVLILIILIVAVISTSVLWLYYHSFFNVVTTSEDTSSLGGALNLCMRIDSVGGNKTYLRNCGSVPIKNDTIRVFIDEIPFSFSMSQSSLVKGEVGTIEINTQNIGLGSHKLKITAKNGYVERYVNVSLSGSDKVLKLLEAA